MAKMVEEMVEEVKGVNSSYNRDNNGFCGVHVDNVMPSSGKTAIVYQTAGSNWNREGFHGGGISYFQGTSVYNGDVDLVVKSHAQWRSGVSAANDTPGNRYFIDEFVEGDDGTHKLALTNCCGREEYQIDFGKKEVKRI